MKYNPDRSNYKFNETWSHYQDAKRPISTYYPSETSPHANGYDSTYLKTIEESKENMQMKKKVLFSASTSNFNDLGYSALNKHQNSQDSSWLRATIDLAKINKTKSTKKLCFAQEKEGEGISSELNLDLKPNFEKKDRLDLPKTGRMDELHRSMGYKTNRNDFKINITKPKEMKYDNDDIERRIKMAKSQRRLKFDVEENKIEKEDKDYKNEYFLTNSSKSSKKIQQISQSVTDYKYKSSKKLPVGLFPQSKESKQAPSTSFLLSSPKKSYKEIKQDPIRERTNKRAQTYLLKLDHDSENVYSKKHLTAVDQFQKFKPIGDQLERVKPMGDQLERVKPMGDQLERVKPMGDQFQKVKPMGDNIQKIKPKGVKKLSIDDFQLGKCKGEGAFGQVFPAVHKLTRMLVAIKKIPKEKVKYMLQQFINEIKIQMFLNHANIVQLYGFFDDTTNFYIIMEYMQGGSIYGLLKKQKKFTEEETVQKLREVCLGLKEMHDNSILHRDIKPQNIVLTNGVCKLCDFGWSAICKDRRTTYCGTLDYVSPQIIEGEGYDDSVDIWCIGVLAYEMICGKAPFYNISRKETMKNIMKVTYEYPPELSESARKFVDSILKRNPDERLGIDQVLKNKFLAN